MRVNVTYIKDNNWLFVRGETDHSYGSDPWRKYRIELVVRRKIILGFDVGMQVR